MSSLPACDPSRTNRLHMAPASCRGQTHFVEPRVVCEVEFTEWMSRSNQLRHPSFKRLRDDRPPRKCPRNVVRQRFPLEMHQ